MCIEGDRTYSLLSIDFKHPNLERNVKWPLKGHLRH